MMWQKIAEAYGFRLPKERIDAITPTLNDLREQVRAALDRDLSTEEPVGVFRPRRERP